MQSCKQIWALQFIFRVIKKFEEKTPPQWDAFWPQTQAFCYTLHVYDTVPACCVNTTPLKCMADVTQASRLQKSRTLSQAPACLRILPPPKRLTLLFKSWSSASGTMKNPWILLFKSGQHQDQQIGFQSSKIMPKPRQAASCHGEDHRSAPQVSTTPPSFNLTPHCPYGSQLGVMMEDLP